MNQDIVDDYLDRIDDRPLMDPLVAETTDLISSLIYDRAEGLLGEEDVDGAACGELAAEILQYLVHNLTPDELALLKELLPPVDSFKIL